MRHYFFIILALFLCGAPAFADDYESARGASRDWVMKRARPWPHTIAPRGNDLALHLVDQLKFSNLASMEREGLMESRLEVAPWSGSYWPTYAGGIANRYGDPDYDAAMIWKYNRDYLERSLGQGKDEFLSPAEKYDLLVGDNAFTLSKRQIQGGAPYANEEGAVPTWFGLCHGWAAAAFMVPRPDLGVTATAASGRKIYFTPSDLKALVTLLWANAAGETRFVGGRCNQENPDRDPEHRETNPDCFDTNPATWHLSVVNQIAVGKRSFVMDASAAAEVWNQPVVAYRYGYIQPITGQRSSKLAEAKVKLKEWAQDPFKDHRSSQAVNVVKVVMTVEYTAENQPRVSPEDGPELDSHYVQVYTYDLELDAADEIVGGEWHTSVHPDFLWLPVSGSRAVSVGDSQLNRNGDRSLWSGREPMPESWREAARYASRYEQPLARVVEKLLEMVREGR